MQNQTHTPAETPAAAAVWAARQSFLDARNVYHQNDPDADVTTADYKLAKGEQYAALVKAANAYINAMAARHAELFPRRRFARPSIAYLIRAL